MIDEERISIMTKHYKSIDILRGIAITLVILGHAIIVFPINLHDVHGALLFLHGFPLYICRSSLRFLDSATTP